MGAESAFQESFEMDTPREPTRRGNRNFTRSFGAASSRDEMNLAEFPLAVLSTRVNPSVKTLEFKDYQRKPNGELVERKWIITGADKFGLPTSTDDDVVLGLMRMTMDQGFREPKVYFTRYELLKTLRWSTEGRSYSRLIKSLDRLSGVRIRSTNSFYDNTTKSYQTCNFGIIDAYEINDERGGRVGEAETKSFFTWSDVLFDSFKAGFVKKLDLEFYFSLKSAVSRRLYRYLDKHFYYKSALELPLTVLAFEKIGLSRSYKYISSIRQQLEPGAKELVEAGFLGSFEFAGSGSQTVIRFSAKRNVQVPAGKPEISIDETPDSLLQSLITRGIADRQASKLLAPKSEEERRKIELIIRYYDALVARNDSKISKNPVGFLYRAVESSERFILPEPEKPAKKRPELKVFSAATTNDDSSAAVREEYKRYLDSAIAEGITSKGVEFLSELQQTVESKMATLRPILSPERFSEAVAGCVKEELIKQFSLPSFEQWVKRSKR